MVICQPPPGGVVGGPLSKQKIIGKAKGDPNTQMASATHSIAGLTASKPSAQIPKQGSKPHPPVQQSQQTASTHSSGAPNDVNMLRLMMAVGV
eukprot:scaffold1170_cov122-Cylindrotheca_fusiformis.AAC.15